MFAKLEPRGFKGLAYWDNGFKVLTVNKGSVALLIKRWNYC
jgi:TRAP-type C4-dicarboxylate transport system substrate-binding protein